MMKHSPNIIIAAVVAAKFASLGTAYAGSQHFVVRACPPGGCQNPPPDCPDPRDPRCENNHEDNGAYFVPGVDPRETPFGYAGTGSPVVQVESDADAGLVMLDGAGSLFWAGARGGEMLKRKTFTTIKPIRMELAPRPGYDEVLLACDGGDIYSYDPVADAIRLLVTGYPDRTKPLILYFCAERDSVFLIADSDAGIPRMFEIKDGEATPRGQSLDASVFIIRAKGIPGAIQLLLSDGTSTTELMEMRFIDFEWFPRHTYLHASTAGVFDAGNPNVLWGVSPAGEVWRGEILTGACTVEHTSSLFKDAYAMAEVSTFAPLEIVAVADEDRDADEVKVHFFTPTGGLLPNFPPYTLPGVSKAGANVAIGQLGYDGTDKAREEIVATKYDRNGNSPGTSDAFILSAFWRNSDGTLRQLDRLSLYGNSWGANVAIGDITGDGIDELAFAPAPAPAAAAHIKVYEVDQAAKKAELVTAWFAYGTTKFGGDVAVLDVTGDGRAEVITAPGPGAVFGPHIRGFELTGRAVKSLARVNFYAFGTMKLGANVEGADFDGDGIAELLVTPGPSAAFGTQAKAFKVLSNGVKAVQPNVMVAGSFGANASATSHLLAMAPGPDPGALPWVSVYSLWTKTCSQFLAGSSADPYSCRPVIGVLAE